MKPIFSGHETFKCKTHWLKRGYDFILNNNNFNADDAVIHLGVGKNMVSSIKFWMKAFGFINEENSINNIAEYLLDNNKGKDPFFEDMGTLWLLHFLLINTNYSTIYRTTFVDFHRLRNEIDKTKLQNFIKVICFKEQYTKLYNEKTIKKDIDVLLHNYYCQGKDSIEEQNALLAPLNLIRSGVEKDSYIFNYKNQNNIPAEIFLYAILKSKGDTNSISFELLQELSLIFCLDNNELLELTERVCSLYPTDIIFSDNSGIKELQFKKQFNELEVLNTYYA